MQKLPVLMTASVSTRGMKNACFSDEEREKMYAETIRFYIENILSKNSAYKIVFVENSGWDLSNIYNTIQYNTIQYNKPLTDRIEFISLNPDLFDIGKGKGYNELLLMNMAIQQSQFIKEAKAFLKVTGRYPIRNVKYFVDYGSKLIFEKGKDLYIDIKDHKLYDWLGLGWNGHSADVRIFAATVSFYENNIGNRYLELNDFNHKYYAENLFFDIVKPLKRQQNIIARFKKEPVYEGLQGHEGKGITFNQNTNSIREKIKRLAGNFIRTFLPFFWF